MSIGQRIKETRRHRGMSQSELAKRVGLTQATLSDLENDKSRGSAKIASIANTLGVRPFWLETGRGSPESQESEAPTTLSTATPIIFSATGAASGYLTEYQETENSLLDASLTESSFFIRVKNDAFGGRLWPGDFLAVEQTAETQPGDIVFAEFTDGRRGIWMLRFVRNEEICLDPLSRQEESITLNKSEFVGMSKIKAVIFR
jgi:transcriptional regulator with XRE-family HTH domain